MRSRRLTPRGPHWRGAFEGYSKAWVHRNHWRVVKHIGDKEDALQECAAVFYRLREHYRGEIDSPAHLMALFKITLAREWIALTQKSLALVDVEDIPDMVEWEWPVAEIAVAWHEQSSELRHVLTVLSDAPTEVLQFLFQHASVNDMNNRIKQFCGIRSRRNVIRELRRLIAG